MCVFCLIIIIYLQCSRFDRCAFKTQLNMVWCDEVSRWSFRNWKMTDEKLNILLFNAVNREVSIRWMGIIVLRASRTDKGHNTNNSTLYLMPEPRPVPIKQQQLMSEYGLTAEFYSLEPRVTKIVLRITRFGISRLFGRGATLMI